MRIPALALFALILGAQERPPLPPAATKPVDFAQDVEPILKRSCLGCHNAQMLTAGLRVDDVAALVSGGASGKALIPGQSAASVLVHRMVSTAKGFAMPPAGQRLTEAEVGIIRAWIDQGAKPSAVSASKAVEPQPVGHWAFRPIRSPQLPAVRDRAWVRNEIDRFVLARLEAENITPSAEAGKATLFRRVSLDLTGLPPSPVETRAFLADNRPDAYERAVDRLLNSPHYGEKWGRHWLDLAHYGDSDGFEKDLTRPHAWRYREWVINALNADMPFDRFTIEQLAGDLLPDATTEQQIATGFLRQALTNREAGVDRTEARFDQLVNRTNTISTTWLGMTAGCAQCHTHKYDPISHKEYYSLLAFVENSTDELIDAPLPGELGEYLRAYPAYEKKRTALLAEAGVPELMPVFEKRLIQAMDQPGESTEWDFHVTEWRARYDNADRIIRTPAGQRNRYEAAIPVEFFLNMTGGPDLRANKDLVEKLKKTRDELRKLNESLPPLARAMVMRENPTPAKGHIRLKGEAKELGEEVEPGVLRVLPPLPPGPKNRLTLARWLVAPEHPLTARVITNRIWQEYFGRGIVNTSEDFGTQGEKPTHPELLDWLASRFIERGWSMKELHRTIVTSATYRQSSQTRPELQDKDPENTLLSRQIRLRLPAELLRDNALAASGLLDLRIGGKSVKPPQPAGISELVYGGSAKWIESSGGDRYRRGMYIFFQRTAPYPMLMNFDAPEGSVACSRRRRSNSPLQALNTLNDPVFVEAAQGLAVRVIAESAGADENRVKHAFRLCLTRDPNPRETQRLVAYLQQQRDVLRQDLGLANAMMPYRPAGVSELDAAAYAGLGRVLLNLDEFLNRE